jgi:hypothetical protein
MQEIYKKNYACIKKGTGQCKKTDVMSVPLPNHKQWAWRGVIPIIKKWKKGGGHNLVWTEDRSIYFKNGEKKRIKPYKL